MNELQRQAYLQAMGVDSYMPRLQLPGALPSALCVIPVAPVAISEKPSGPLASPPHLPADSQGSAAAMQALLGESSSARQEPSAPVGRVVEAAGEAGQSPVERSGQVTPHFALSIIRGAQLLVIDDGLQGAINPSEYLQLLQNILFALGAGKQVLAIDAFVWPMVKNSQVDQSELAARQTLQAILAKQIQQLDARFVILMGDIAAHYSGAESMPAGEMIEVPDLSAPVICTQSASSLLSNPDLKACMWSQLQPLYRYLQRQHVDT